MQEQQNVCLNHINHITSHHDIIRQASVLFICSYRLIQKTFNHASKDSQNQIYIANYIIFGLRICKEILILGNLFCYYGDLTNIPNQ